MKWEYKIISFPISETELNFLGSNNWELIQNYGDGMDKKFIFKRPFTRHYPKGSMNPNKTTSLWQDIAKQLSNPLIDIKKARDIRNGLSLVNIANITDEDYQLLRRVLK